MSNPPAKLDVPFPALTPAQRYHLDMHGYVVVPGVLSADEIAWIKDDLYRLRRDLMAIPDPQQRMIDHAYFQIDQPHHHYIGAIGQSRRYPGLLHYITHPRVVGMSEELMGGRGHIVEANAHINRKAPEWSTAPDGGPAFGFHRGLSPHEGHHYVNGLYHANFIKVLTNLTDLGPDDGGTVVVAGSHKVPAEDRAIIDAAYVDRSLIHQVIAPAGSALLFTEALIHATGRITSDRERAIIIAGYATTMFPWQFMESHRPDFRFEPDFAAAIPEPLRYLYISKGYIQREARYRKLSEPADTRTVAPVQWPFPRQP